MRMNSGGAMGLGGKCLFSLFQNLKLEFALWLSQF